MERNKYLMELVYGPKVEKPEHWVCDTKYALHNNGELLCPQCQTASFSDWDGFGNLWEWAQEQVWWELFLFESMHGFCEAGNLFKTGNIHPDRFANAVYEFLKERE